MSNYSQEFLSAIQAEVLRRLFDESFPRLRQCLGELDEAAIWYRPNEHSNSVGNLVLHLCGNARQWIISGLGGMPDTRKRQAEFDEQGPIPVADLEALLDVLEKDIRQVMAQLSPEDLLRERPVQIYVESGLSILIHVVEHFSYHVGQIVYFVKTRKNKDMGFYAGQDLGGTSH
ncbi:MAG TPA: DinB family protein [Saprospiraceae bacterium]|nr:DinB family protein [Saprospiraceae bacterium]HMQ84288.1 DinB family protein [Saprospiraceae bacterium]